jgi:hypothetical protein
VIKTGKSTQVVASCCFLLFVGVGINTTTKTTMIDATQINHKQEKK